MSNDEIRKLKNRRDNLSCKLSIMRRDVENPNFNKTLMSSKINKGIELSNEFQELTNVLIKEGCNLNSKAPYLFPHWWSSIDKHEKITLVQQPVATRIQEYIPAGEVLDLNSIKQALKDVICESNLGCKECTYNYNINLAWIGECDVEIISKYLTGMGLGLQYSDADPDRGEYFNKYSIVCTENEYKCIMKSSQLILDILNLKNIEIYGKKC